jgi:hypothetical protein
MNGGLTRRKTAVRQLELIRPENPNQPLGQPLLLNLDEETLRELIALMAEAILAVRREPEVEDER